jgi:hypothetical protein
MSANILSTIMQFLTPDLIAKIASVCGLERTTAERAIGAAVPAILSGLAGLGSKPEGASLLAATLAQQPRDALDSFSDTIGSGSRSFADNGMRSMTSLLGGDAVGALAGAVSRLQGVGEGSVRSLLGLLAPVVLGVLGREQRSSGLDASGLARMLTSQTEHFASAMPARLSAMLDTSEVFRRGSFASEPFVPSTASYAPVQAQRGNASSWSWAYWVLPLLALAGLVGYLLQANEPTRQAAEAPPMSTAEALSAAQNLVVGGSNIGRQLVTTVEALGTNLEKMKDPGSAAANLPVLQTTAKELDRLATLARQLPAESRGTLANFVKASAPKLNSTLAAALALPGVSAIIKPTVDELRSKLDTIAMASGTFTQDKPSLAIGEGK